MTLTLICEGVRILNQPDGKKIANVEFVAPDGKARFNQQMPVEDARALVGSTVEVTYTIVPAAE